MKTVIRKVAIDASVKILERSPVDTGRFRASWRFNEGSVDDTVAPPGPNSVPSVSIPQLSGEEPFYISNSLPYAIALEEGHSQQAPLGIVGITVAELEADLKSLFGGKIE